MITGQKGIKYGLQVRKPEERKGVNPAPTRPSIFGDDGSDEEEDNVERQIARHASRKQADKKIAEMHTAALAQDASIFDYDSHYDSIQESRGEPKRREKLARESRYIASLLETAEERKREQSVLYERQLAKEREAEDHLYGDKERFVTAAYRKKLEEEARWKAERKQREEEEEQNAVEKKGHMGDFYRNLLRNNVAFGAVPATQPASSRAQLDRNQQLTAEEAASKIESKIETKQHRKDETEWKPQEGGNAQAAAVPTATEPTDITHQQRGPEREHELMDKNIIAENTNNQVLEVRQGEEFKQQKQVMMKEDRMEAVAAARERYLARKRKAENLQ